MSTSTAKPKCGWCWPPESGAFLYYGFSRDITKEEFERRIRENTLTEALHAVPVQKGDAFFIPSGTLHAICRGIVIAEVQQNSNVTYRVYDYGRVGADGKPSALHIPQAVAVTDLHPAPALDFGPHLGQCAYFTTDSHTGSFTETADETSFVSLLVTAGTGRLVMDGETMPLSAGDSVFLPAGSGDFRVEGDCTVLLTRV